MSETVKVLTSNKLIYAVLLLILPVSAAIASTQDVFSMATEIKYVDPGNERNSITFYPDSSISGISGTFYIEQASGHNISGTYIESERSYEIVYTKTGYGESIRKVSNGIEVPDGNEGTEIWNKV